MGGSLLFSLLRTPRTAVALFAVVLAVHLLGWGVDHAYHSLNYTAWFAGINLFQCELFTVQIPCATTSELMVLLMLVLTGNFMRFFLRYRKA